MSIYIIDMKICNGWLISMPQPKRKVDTYQEITIDLTFNFFCIVIYNQFNKRCKLISLAKRLFVLHIIPCIKFMIKKVETFFQKIAFLVMALKSSDHCISLHLKYICRMLNLSLNGQTLTLQYIKKNCIILYGIILVKYINGKKGNI